MTELPSEGERYRRLSPGVKVVQTIFLSGLTLLGALWALDFHYLFDLAFYREQFLGVIFAVGMPAIFIGVRQRRSVNSDQVPWYDSWRRSG